MSYGPECPKCGNRNRTEVKALFTSTYVYCGLCDSDVAPKPVKTKVPGPTYGSIVLTKDMLKPAKPQAYVYDSVRYVLIPSKGKYWNPGSTKYEPNSPYEGEYLEALGYKPEW